MTSAYPTLNCPYCHTEFEVRPIVLTEVEPAPSRPAGLPQETLDAVRAFVEAYKPGRVLFADLREAWERQEGPSLSDRSLALALQHAGATKWRTPTARGYVIPAAEGQEREAYVPKDPVIAAALEREIARRAAVQDAPVFRDLTPERIVDTRTEEEKAAEREAFERQFGLL